MDVLILMQGMVPEPGRAVTGNGLRALALREGLRPGGHRVRLVTRAVDLPGEPDDDEVLVYDEPSDIAGIVRSSGADALIVCHWDLLEALEDPCPVPVIVDLYGPRLVETQFEKTDLDREAVRFVETLRRGDCFLVATERQRWFALPWLMLAGFDCRQLPVHVVPIAANPELVKPRPAKEVRIVSGGVFWPWRECETGLTAVIDTLEKSNRGTLELFGGSYPLATEASVDYRDPRDRLPESKRLRFSGMLPYDELLANYRSATAAFDVMARNSERELSFSFRVIDYLACGVPVITNDFTEIASDIARFEAGWLVDLDDPESISRVIQEVLADPKETRRRGRNAQRLAAERYTWDIAVEALDRYLREPRRAVRQPSLLGSIIAVSNDAYRAREDRLQEIERSRKAIRRAEDLDEKLSEMRQEEAELAGKLTWARSELESKTQDLDQAKERVRAVAREHASKLEERTAERDAMRAELTRRDERLRELEEARDRTKRDADEQAQRVHALEASARHAEQIKREIEAAADRALRDVDAARGERDQARDRIDSLRTELGTAGDSIKELRAETARVGEELRTLRAELTHRTAERDKGLVDLARLETARGALENERDQARDRIESLRTELATAGDEGKVLRAQVAQGEEALRTLRGTLEHRTAERDRGIVDLARGESVRAALTAERDQARDRIDALRADIAQGKDEIENLRARAERADEDGRKLRADLDHRTAERDRARTEGARLESALATANTERDLLGQRIEGLTRERDALEGKVASGEKRLEARTSELEEMAREVAQLRGIIDRRTADLERKHAELEEAREAIGTAEQQVHDQSRRAAALEDRIDERNEELRLAKDATSEAVRGRDQHRAQAEQLHEQLEKTRAEVHQRESELHELQAQHGALRTQLEEVQQDNARERLEVERLKHEVIGRDRDLTYFRGESEKKDGSIARLEEKQHEILGSLDAARADHERLELEIKRLEHEGAQARTDLGVRATEIQARDREIERLSGHKGELERALESGGTDREQLRVELAELRASFPVRLWSKLTRKG